MDDAKCDAEHEEEMMCILLGLMLRVAMLQVIIHPTHPTNHTVTQCCNRIPLRSVLSLTLFNGINLPPAQLLDSKVADSATLNLNLNRINRICVSPCMSTCVYYD